MVEITRVYTRTGDDGTTGLVGGSRTKKDSLRVTAYGDIDELNSCIGFAASFLPKKAKQLQVLLLQIQNNLFDLGAEIASPHKPRLKMLEKISSSHSTELEQSIDEWNDSLPELRSFILPGGSQSCGALHIARAVCRRAERSLIILSRKERVRKEALIYMNRLSDLLFVLARSSARIEKKSELLWVPSPTAKKKRA